jgi:hypothetical protein
MNSRQAPGLSSCVASTVSRAIAGGVIAGDLRKRREDFRRRAVAGLEQRAVTNARAGAHRRFSMSEFKGSPRHAPAGLGKLLYLPAAILAAMPFGLFRETRAAFSISSARRL